MQSAEIPLASKDFGGKFSAAERLHAGLHGGDDYELLFCVAKSKAAKIPRELGGIEVTEIGEITSDQSIELLELSGKSRGLVAGGWDPFSKTDSR